MGRLEDDLQQEEAARLAREQAAWGYSRKQDSTVDERQKEEDDIAFYNSQII